MSSFYINTANAKTECVELYAVSRKIDQCIKKLDNISCGRGLSASGKRAITNNLENCRDALGEQKRSYDCMVNGLDKIIGLYMGTEKSIINDRAVVIPICADIGQVTIGEDDSVISNYWNIIEFNVGSKINNYLKKLEGCDNSADIFFTWNDWLKKDLFGDIKGIDGWAKAIMEEVTDGKVDKYSLFGKTGGKFLKTFSDAQWYINIIKKSRDAIMGEDTVHALYDIEMSIFKKEFKELNKTFNKIRGIEYKGVKSQLNGVLVDVIFQMPKDWIAGIEEYAKTGNGTAGSIMAEILVGTPAKAIADSAKPIYTTATELTYPIIDEICESVGYDLSGEYERLTGKTGIEAVYAAQKELWVDIIGGGIKDGVAKGVDAVYDFAGDVADGAKSLWNGFKSLLRG